MSQDFKSKATIVRQEVIKMLNLSQSGHPGGSLSAADIMTVLFFDEMNIDPKDPKKADRDRFVLSKGHAAPILYAVLAERGFFEKEELKTLRQVNSNLQGHPNMNDTLGVDMSTGSLGQGISAAAGMALANKIDQKEDRIYALLGDGEVQEGLVWEAAMFAAHYKLDNLTAILDNNGLQIDGANSEVMGIEPLDQKWESFGWNVIKIDGHNFDDIQSAFKEARATKGKPTMILAKTVKGKGVSFMENEAGWHGSAPNDEQTKQALKELGGAQ